MLMGGMEMSFIMLLSVFSGGGFGGSMGLPPGERDAKLIQAAPADAVLFVEWAERGPGKPGGKGIDGFAADPEVKQFFGDVWKAIEAGIAKGTAEGDPAEKALGQNIPPLVKLMLNRSGCFTASFDPKLLKEGDPPAGGPGRPDFILRLLPGVKAALIVNGGKDADKIAGHLDALVKLLPADKRKEGLKRQPIPLPETPFTLTLHRHGDYFILAFGEKAVDEAIAGLDGKSKGLAGNPTFAEAAKRVTFGRNANMMYLNVKGGIDKAATVAGKEVTAMVKLLGLETVDVLVSATGVEDGAIRTRSYLGTGGKTDGVLALFSGRGIKAADFKHIPADSDLVLSFSVNAKNVLKAVRTIVAAADDVSAKRLEALIKDFERRLGLELEKDLLAAFGDVWTIHNSKSAGGFFLTSAVASLEVKDPKKAADVFAKLMDVLEEAMPGEMGRGRFRRRAITLKRKTFMGQGIYFVNIVGDDVPFAPAFCLTKTHLLAAPHPQALKAHLRFLKDGGKTFADRIGKDLKLPEGDVLGVSYIESKEMLRVVYGLVPYFGQVMLSMMQSQGAEIDIFSLPSARAVLPYFGNSWSTTVRTEKGIVSEAHNVIPGASAAPVMMMLPWIMFSARARAFDRARPARKLNDLLRNPKARTTAWRRLLKRRPQKVLTAGP